MNKINEAYGPHRQPRESNAERATVRRGRHPGRAGLARRYGGGAGLTGGAGGGDRDQGQEGRARAWFGLRDRRRPIRLVGRRRVRLSTTCSAFGGCRLRQPRAHSITAAAAGDHPLQMRNAYRRSSNAGRASAGPVDILKHGGPADGRSARWYYPQRRWPTGRRRAITLMWPLEQIRRAVRIGSETRPDYQRAQRQVPAGLAKPTQQESQSQWRSAWASTPHPLLSASGAWAPRMCRLCGMPF